MVAEFRDTIERSIENTNKTALGERPDKRKYAKTGDLHFVSVSKSDMRLSVVGLGPEHRWACVRSDFRINRYSGHLAIVSLEGTEDSLLRRVAIKSPMQGFEIDNEKLLDEESVIKSALDWARSPNVYADNLEGLAKLGLYEEYAIESEYGQIAEEQRKLEADLEAIHNAHRRSLIDIHNVILD
jgi:hypothetical protein